MDEPRSVLDSQGTIWVAIQECHQVVLKAFDGSGRQVQITIQRLNSLSNTELRKLVDRQAPSRRNP